MILTFKSFILRRILVIASFIIVALILWNTFDFFQKFKTEERLKMEILASAQKEMATNLDLNASMNLPLKILENNKSIPMILVNNEGEITTWQNLDSIKATDHQYLFRQLAKMKSENKPIVIPYYQDQKNYIYYRNSDLLNKLKYYPIALILILVLFTSVIYLFFKSNKIADQNKLWTGMAKETAHQIGTPLSSLLGWIELLKIENTDPKIVTEIENDINRLNTIAERFSKIGSVPELKSTDIDKLTKDSFEYLKSRSSKKIIFNYNGLKTPVNVLLNAQLYGWVIENLIKNAIDAMQGKGIISFSFIENSKHIELLIKDNGKGIPSNIKKQIFSPGFTTKKRGWGLGLSLSKRIIEDYHNGKISVKKSELGKGTTFSILLNKA